MQKEMICGSCLRVQDGGHTCAVCGGDTEGDGSLLKALQGGERYWWKLVVLRPISAWNETDGATWATEREAIEQWAAWLADAAYRAGWGDALGDGVWFRPQETAKHLTSVCFMPPHLLTGELSNENTD